MLSTSFSTRLRPPIPPTAARQVPQARFAGSYFTFSRVEGARFQHTTSLFREAEQVLALPGILSRFFPNGCPIYNYACSDGSEPYSIATTLAENGIPRHRYPIFARDISPAILQIPKSGYLPIRPEEFERLRKHFPEAKPEAYFTLVPEATPQNVKQFYDPEDRLEGYDLTYYAQGERLYKVSEALRDRVYFERGDLGRDSFQRPGLFLFNNQFRHLSVPEQHDLLTNLYKNLEPGSILLGGPDPTVAKLVGFQPAFPDQYDPKHSVYSALIKPRFTLGQGDGTSEVHPLLQLIIALSRR